MRILTSGTLVVEAYDERVWKQERNVLRVYDPSATKCSVSWPEVGDVLATYTLDAEHKVEIDLSDFIRLHDAGANDVLVRTDGGAFQMVNANYFVAGLIRPTRLTIPVRSTVATIEPPSVMLRAISGNAPVRVEAYAETNYVIVEHVGRDITHHILPYSVASIELQPNVVSLTFGGETEVEKKTIIPRSLDCGRDYVAVRWVSCTGATRLHTWKVSKRKSESANIVTLLTQDGSYNVAKGRKDGFAIRLDGLTSYDYWYYSDVCYSSKVEVSFDGETWQRVNVTTKGVTLPDGDAGTLSKLEVELNYKEYDAITL